MGWDQERHSRYFKGAGNYDRIIDTGFTEFSVPIVLSAGLI